MLACDAPLAAAPAAEVTLRDLFSCGESGLMLVGRTAGGSFMHISRSDPGLACGCVCPGCARPLVARKGRIRRHSFAHWGEVSPGECGKAGETALHRFAKEAIESAGSLFLPAVVAGTGKWERRIRPATELKVETVLLERRTGRVIPDVTCTAGGRRLFVEFAVTHSASEAKTDAYRNMDAGAVEIDLSSYLEYPVRELAAIILTHAPRRWLHSKLIDEAESEIEATMRAERDSFAVRADVLARSLRDLRPVESDGPGQWERSAIEHGLGRALAVVPPVIGPPVFDVACREWAGHLLLAYGYRMGGGFSTDQYIEELVRRGWIRPGFFSVDPPLAEALREREPSFRSPAEMVMDYLGRLHAAGWVRVTLTGKVNATPKLYRTVDASGGDLARPRPRPWSKSRRARTSF